MKVEFTNNFIKVYKKRFSHNKNIQKKFDERTRSFVKNHKDPQLLDHPLAGKLRGYRAFSITGDIRVVYIVINSIAYFYDIGTHNQVYGR